MRSPVGTTLPVLVAALVQLLAACGTRPTPGPVPVAGTRAELDAVSGNWDGQYWTTDGSRRGVLRFQLRPGADTARGEVEMTFSRAMRLYDDPAEEPLPRHPCTVIDIAVVRLGDGRIRGTLVPYWDPDCDCRTFTVFEGMQSGNRVEGTFTSRAAPDSPPRVTGRWFADRRRAS